VVYNNVGIAGNLPFAAAFALVPIAVMAAYLAAAKRLGAFDAL
jgi:putative spermidine/putrescine transport system permease protein